jgi:hypothetical protein
MSRDAGSPRYAQMSTGYDTVLGLKMREAGVRPSRVAARKILAKAVEECRQAGASHNDIVQELSLICEGMRNLADEMPGEGQLHGASNGQMQSADPRQPQGDGAGQAEGADKAIANMPVPSPTQRDGGGHALSADKARSELPPTVSPQSRDVGHPAVADKAIPKAPIVAASESSGGGQQKFADKAMSMMPPPAAPLRLPKGREPGPERLAAQRAVAVSSASAVLSLSHSTRVAGQEFGDWTRQEAMAHWQRNKVHARDTIILRLASAEASSRGAPANKPFRECLDQPTLIRIQKEAMRFIDAA